MDIFNRIYEKTLLQLAYYVKGDKRLEYFKEYKKNLYRSKDEIRLYQKERLSKLIMHAYTTVPYYRDMFDKLKIRPEEIKTSDDLKRLPPLTKDIIIESFDKLVSTNYGPKDLIEDFSGGSTGKRLKMLKDKKYIQKSRAIWLRDLYTTGYSPGDKIAFIWGSPFDSESVGNKLIHKLWWKINRKTIFNPLQFSKENLEKWLKTDFTRFRPDFIYGYANALYEVAKLVKERDIKLPIIKKIISTSERLEHRDFIEQVFGCKVIDHYGCREVLSIGIEDDSRIMYSSDDFVILEISSTGEILLTPLECYGMPLLRYKLGDIAIKNEDKKNVSAMPFDELNLKFARTIEFLRTPKNERVYGAIIYNTAAKENLNIGEYQVVQESLEHINLNIIKQSNTAYKDIERLKEIISTVLGISNVKINYLNQFPIEKSGKKIAFKCLIKDESIAS